MRLARTLVVSAAALAAFLLAAVIAHAHDGKHDAWMHSLERNDGGGRCCNLHDCKVARARIGADGWEAMNQLGAWVKVPDDKIIRNRGNPTGEPVLCWLPTPGVLCFVEPPGA